MGFIQEYFIITLSIAELANFNLQEGHTKRYEFVWGPHVCIHISKGGWKEYLIKMHALFTNKLG